MQSNQFLAHGLVAKQISGEMCRSYSVPEGDAALLEEEGALNGDSLLKSVADACGGGLSFTAPTKVATAHGEQAIGTFYADVIV
jgi:hypothetical protein